jgi:hypothetical protein
MFHNLHVLVAFVTNIRIQNLRARSARVKHKNNKKTWNSNRVQICFQLKIFTALSFQLRKFRILIGQLRLDFSRAFQTALFIQLFQQNIFILNKKYKAWLDHLRKTKKYWTD